MCPQLISAKMCIHRNINWSRSSFQIRRTYGTSQHPGKVPTTGPMNPLIRRRDTNQQSSRAAISCAAALNSSTDAEVQRQSASSTATFGLATLTSLIQLTTSFRESFSLPWCSHSAWRCDSLPPSTHTVPLHICGLHRARPHPRKRTFSIPSGSLTATSSRFREAPVWAGHGVRHPALTHASDVKHPSLLGRG